MKRGKNYRGKWEEYLNMMWACEMTTPLEVQENRGQVKERKKNGRKKGKREPGKIKWGEIQIGAIEQNVAVFRYSAFVVL